MMTEKLKWLFFRVYKRVFRLILLTTIIHLILSDTNVLCAGIKIEPTRIILNGNQSVTDSIALVNISKGSIKGAIAFREYRMDTNGKMTEINVPGKGEFFASEFVSFKPEQFELDSGDTMYVTLELSPQGVSVPDEHRSHLLIQYEPGLNDENDNVKSQVSFQINTVMGITLPVIWRPDPTQIVHVNIDEISFSKYKDYITTHIVLSRIGSISAYGDIRLYHENDQGIKKKIGEARGVGLYTPVVKRRFQLLISETFFEYLNQNGKLIAEYHYKISNFGINNVAVLTQPYIPNEIFQE